MQKVLFICTGNTCRSPMAEVAANEYFKRKGLDMKAFSRGLAVGLNDIMSSGAAEALRYRYNGEYSHRSRQIDAEAVQKSDIIIGITRRHTEAVKELFFDMLKGKTVISMPFDIVDPYGCGIEVYRRCLADIEDGIARLFGSPHTEVYDGFEICDFENRYAKQAFETEKMSFSTPWSEKEFETLAINPNASAFCAVKDGKAVGFAVIYTVGDDAELMDIAVHPDFRRMGIGEALLDRVISVCEEKNIGRIMLEVRKSNINAINLYLRKGFEKVGERKDYYKNPVENAELYDLKLC